MFYLLSIPNMLKPYAVKELNNIDDAGALVPGTTLQVPTVKEVSPVRALDYVAQN